MTLPPCPIPGHNQPHHYHRANGTPVHALDGEHGECTIAWGSFSRCYSAHVPTEPMSAADEWVRVGAGVTIPSGVSYRLESESLCGWITGIDSHVYVRRSDLDKLTPPDPAAMLAGVLTGATGDDWTAADVHGLLQKSGGLTLTLGAEK